MTSNTQDTFVKEVDIRQCIDYTIYSDSNQLLHASYDQRLNASLQVLSELCDKDSELTMNLDRPLLDEWIAKIDDKLSLQLDQILHHPDFQSLESSWRSLYYLVSQIDFTNPIKIDLIDISKEALSQDFSESTDVTESGLYQHVYTQEYDTPGGEPISVIIGDYDFSKDANDIDLLKKISNVSAAAHCPFVGCVGTEFFGQETLEQVLQINDLTTYMSGADFLRWKAFRQQPDARYIGLCFPRFLLRLPYDNYSGNRNFVYTEATTQTQARDYLWGRANFALAANMAKSFAQYGWMVNIRGPESGGKVEDLPLHQFNAGRGLETKIPTEGIISEARELSFSNQGFIPLSYYKNSNFACFFSVNSIQEPTLYNTTEATANSRINARLPYILLTTRLAHYLKVLQREAIGSTKTRLQLEREFNVWLQNLVTQMPDPGPDLMAQRPLRAGSVLVSERVDNPGYYQIALNVMPHFQVEGMDITLSLVSTLPSHQQQAAHYQS